MSRDRLLDRALVDAFAQESLPGKLLDAAPDAMLVVGAEGTILHVNVQAEVIFGYRRAELVGEPIERLVPERFRDAHPQNRRAYGARPQPRPMGAGIALYGRRRDGGEFPAEISLAPCATEHGLMVVAAVRDVTEQRARHAAELREQRSRLEAENERMKEQIRLKSALVATVSHELRAPLNAILGFADLMHRGKVGPMSPAHVEYLGDILTSARHLLRIVDGTLDVARVEAGRCQFVPETAELCPIVHEVRDIVRALADAKGLTVELHVEELGSVVIDVVKLKQVLYNYLSNAIASTSEGGRVDVHVRADGERAFRLEVRDTGIGIAAADLPRLFVEFEQLDSGRARGGAGLGLAVTKRLVEAQGGSVGVTSELGRGSTFWAVLPRALAVGAADAEGRA